MDEKRKEYREKKLKGKICGMQWKVQSTIFNLETLLK